MQRVSTIHESNYLWDCVLCVFSFLFPWWFSSYTFLSYLKLEAVDLVTQGRPVAPPPGCHRRSAIRARSGCSRPPGRTHHCAGRAAVAGSGASRFPRQRRPTGGRTGHGGGAGCE